MYTSNKEVEIKATSLINKLKSGKVQLVGIAYSSDEFPNGILCEPYIDSIDFEKDEKLEFSSKIFIHENDKVNVRYFDRQIEKSGLGYVRLEQGEAGITQSGGLMTDLILKDTILSSTKKIDLQSTFINPTVSYQSIKLQDYTFKIYKITETIDDYTHTVHLLVTDKQYDGQTLLGMLEDSKFNKLQTIQLLRLLSGDKLINKEIAGAYMESSDTRYSLYNTHETGVFVLTSEEKLSVACGQSFINFDLSSIVSSHIQRNKTDAYTLRIVLKNNKKLSIFL